MRVVTSRAIEHVRDLLSLTGLTRETRLLWLIAAMIFLALSESMAFLLIVPLLQWMGGDAVPHESLLLASLCVLAVARVAIGYWLRIGSVWVQHQAKDALRLRVYRALIYAEWRWLSLTKSEHHAQILMSGIGQICGGGIQLLVGICANLFLLAGYVTVAFVLAWQVALVAIVGALFMAWLLRHQRRRAVRQGESLAQANRAMFRFLKGGLGQLRELKISGGEERFLSQFAEVNDRFRQQQFAYERQEGKIVAAMQFGLLAAILGLSWASVALIKLELAQLFPAILLIMRISPMLTNVHASYTQWLQIIPQVAAARGLLEDSGVHGEAGGGGKDEPLTLRHQIVLDCVSVRYAGRSARALNDVSLTIAAGSTTIITGRSGSGKSSLADVLMGLIEPDGGRTLIDDIVLNGMMRRRWRASVGYVQQNATLFDDTIRANLLWGRPSASDAELAQALTMAAADFVMDLPDGLDTLVGEAGLRLSGGERQRISLARVLLRKPSLLILDEATSALDPENEAAINRAIAGLAGRMTIVIIGHRLTAQDRADQWITLANGKIVQS